MRTFRLATLLFTLSALLSIPIILASCGGGGSSGSSGPIYMNSRLTGTYEFIFLMSGSTDTVEAQAGTTVFDGNGHGSYSTYASTASETSGTFTYTVTSGNTINLDGMLSGDLRSDGSFFAGTVTSGGGAGMMLATKLSSSMTDTAITYIAGQSSWDTISSTDVLQVGMHDPIASQLTWSILYSSGIPTAGTADYTFNQDGSLSSPITTPTNFGAVTPDYDLMIFGDAENAVDSRISALCGFKLATSASLTTLHGTYILHEFDDGLPLGGGYPVAHRGRVTFDGAGNGTYTLLADSTGGPVGGTENFTYSVLPNGMIQLITSGPTMGGVVLQDGSVFGLVDHDAGDNVIGVSIGVRK